MPDKSLRSEADKIINELREEGAQEKLEAKRTVIKGSKINKESFGRKIGVGSLSKRVANNEKKITSIKKIIQFNKSDIGDKLKSLDDSSDKDKNIFATGLSKILETISGIGKSFNNRLKSEKKTKEKRRINLNRQRKTQREDVLESKTAVGDSDGQTEVSEAQGPGFLGGIVRFFKNILIGTALLSLLKWVQNPDNLKKLQATLDFLSNHGDTIFSGLVLLVGGMATWRVWKIVKNLNRLFKGKGGGTPTNVRGTSTTNTRFNNINNRRTTSGGQQLNKGPLNRVREFFRKKPIRSKTPITGDVTRNVNNPFRNLKNPFKNFKNPFRSKPPITGDVARNFKNPFRNLKMPKNLKMSNLKMPNLKNFKLPKTTPKGGSLMTLAADMIINYTIGKGFDYTNNQILKMKARDAVKKHGKSTVLNKFQERLVEESAKPDKPWWHLLNDDMGVGSIDKKTGTSRGKYRDDKLVEEFKYMIQYVSENEFKTNEKGKVETTKIQPSGDKKDITGDDSASQIVDDSVTKETKLKPYDLILKHGYQVVDEEVNGKRMVKVYNPDVKYESGPGKDFGRNDGQNPSITVLGTYASKDKVSTEDFINAVTSPRSDKLSFNPQSLNNMSTETVNKLNKDAKGGGLGRVVGGVADFLTLGTWDFDKRNKKGSPKDWGIRRAMGGVADAASMGLTDFDKRGKGNLQFEAIGSNKGDKISQKVSKKDRKITLLPIEEDSNTSSSGSGSDQSEIPASPSTSGVESNFTSGVYGLVGAPD